MFKNLFICFALATAAAAPPVFAQADQSGFISIDCGLSDSDSPYNDNITGISYTSDSGFTTAGESKVVPNLPADSIKQSRSVRSFPDGTRNCYTMRPGKGKNNKYLIRARFLYGNYDGLNRLPQFDLYIGEDLWTTVSFRDPEVERICEILHTPTTDFVHICLQKTDDESVPFISALELRPLNNIVYIEARSMSLHKRLDFGADPDLPVRFPLDKYDRIWEPDGVSNEVRTVRTRSEMSSNDFFLPDSVINTAITPRNSNDSLTIYWRSDNSSDDKLRLYLHFADVEQLKSNDLREFKIYLNEDEWNDEYSPLPLQPRAIWSSSDENYASQYKLSLNATENSTLPPIINAMEIYVVKFFKNYGTDDLDVGTIFGIKSYYGVTKNWTGDPCRPRHFAWDGLRCNYGENSSTITSLNLSSSQLVGSVAPDIADLTSLQILDLSNNNLSGSVPEFLGQLARLMFLNLEGNNFSGPIPIILQEKSKQGSLTFRINPLQTNSSLDTRKKKNNIALQVATSTIAALLVIICIVTTMYVVRKRKRRVIKEIKFNTNKSDGSLETRARQVTYAEVLKITSNFAKVLGKGGFGTVYYGLMGDTEVAVKMLSSSSNQGYKEFQSEANLLMSVHHKNLTSFLGYCYEESHMGIIYEYMANGNLQQHLPELSWEERLCIAIDAAQGLQYLHNGCKPPIIHRDVKLTNILLDRNFQAKLSDFGLSKVFPNEGASHISTLTMVGTPGYLDPECHTTYRFTEKSDVYSFGVVLLEVVTGRPVIDMKQGNRHIADWVYPFLEKGDIRTIVDARLNGKFNINSAWKIVELGMSCVSQPSTRRPFMYDVVIELKECFEIETSNFEAQPTSISHVVDSECGPFAR